MRTSPRITMRIEVQSFTQHSNRLLQLVLLARCRSPSGAFLPEKTELLLAKAMPLELLKMIEVSLEDLLPNRLLIKPTLKNYGRVFTQFRDNAQRSKSCIRLPF